MRSIYCGHACAPFVSFLPAFPPAIEATPIVVVVWRTCDEWHCGGLCCCVWVVLVCVAACGRHPITSPERSSFPAYRDEGFPAHRPERPCTLPRRSCSSLLVGANIKHP